MSMLGFIPRLRRRVDRENWMPIGEDESNAAIQRFADPTTSARVEGPPNFLNPIPPPCSPPPSYAQIRNASKPEIANLLVGSRTSYGTPASPTNATPRQSMAPVMSSTITGLEDIRHGEVVNHIQMDNRISSVPNYPVFLEHPPTSRRRQSRRPASIASTSTTGLFLSVGQLPGSEPFDVGTSQTASSRIDWRRSQAITSPLFSPGTPSEPSIARTVTVQRVQTTQLVPRRAPRGANQLSWLPDQSDGNLVERERCSPPNEGFYAPVDVPPAIKQVRTWPVPTEYTRHQGADYDVRVRFAGVNAENPPPPPPKDPGYVPLMNRARSRGQQGDYGLRKTHSSPNLLRFTGLHRKNNEQENHHQGTGWDEKAGRIAESPRPSAGIKFSNRRSHFLNALGKFISRSVPRVAVSTA